MEKAFNAVLASSFQFVAQKFRDNGFQRPVFPESSRGHLLGDPRQCRQPQRLAVHTDALKRRHRRPRHQNAVRAMRRSRPG